MTIETASRWPDPMPVLNLTHIDTAPGSGSWAAPGEASNISSDDEYDAWMMARIRDDPACRQYLHACAWFAGHPHRDQEMTYTGPFAGRIERIVVARAARREGKAQVRDEPESAQQSMAL